ncbi:Spore protein [Caenorhabditis elegans]|uniref:Spore protein n=1 Tax=Caenorhabditis elegans TaxID=6239 RepID=D3NQ86_CAEEL|nr:Spore protein [Caenorhabditis elegans]CCD64679.1 Spore protein [Caenorhabditis elegans]|eukprot:NP_001254040.1 Uncharacterized protein CELE_C16C4.18 [Caenorhabditis elegans]
MERIRKSENQRRSNRRKQRIPRRCGPATSQNRQEDFTNRKEIGAQSDRENSPANHKTPG